MFFHSSFLNHEFTCECWLDFHFTRMFIIIMFILIIQGTEGLDKGSYLGCFKYSLFENQEISTESGSNPDGCISKCEEIYYRYTFILKSNSCACGNYLGEEINTTLKCNDFCKSEPTNYPCNFTDVYLTGFVVSGPPQNFIVKNITSNNVHISWKEPKSYVNILSYVIKAYNLESYSSYPPLNSEWVYPNNTFQTVLNLQSATKYNITVQAKSTDGLGAPASQEIITEVGDPDYLPTKPEIIHRHGQTEEIRINPVSNNNGPVSFYHVIVVNDDRKQEFVSNLLKSYYEAKNEDISYYIAAELKPKEIETTFIVGDGRYYGKYYNAPLDPETHYVILTGIVSEFHGITKYAYSNLKESKKKLVLDVAEDDMEQTRGDSQALIITLATGIGFLTVLVVIAIIVVIFLRDRFNNRRRRLPDQEMTIQGPMIHMDNDGYVPEEDRPGRVSYYNNLVQKIRLLTIPTELTIEHNSILGIGGFGHVTKGTLNENDGPQSVATYCIADKSLSPEGERHMLMDFDILIRTEKHDNIVQLIGTSETPDTLYVVFELFLTSLKAFLINSRQISLNSFCTLSEPLVMGICIQIGRGMVHLHNKTILHKYLCCNNIYLDENFVPKIAGHGLINYDTYQDGKKNYTRWSALEVLKGQPHNAKSDVWSFGVLLWEILSLGGTPYGNILDDGAVRDRINQGMRLNQTVGVSDEIYEVMLSCWQVNMDERFSMATASSAIESARNNRISPTLCFDLQQNFRYEPYFSNLETVSGL